MLQVILVMLVLTLTTRLSQSLKVQEYADLIGQKQSLKQILSLVQVISLDLFVQLLKVSMPVASTLSYLTPTTQAEVITFINYKA